MPIPKRFRTARLAKSEIREFVALCNAIEDGLNRNEDVSALLKRWNKRASRRFEPVEFTTYYGAVSAEEFVKSALMPGVSRVEDLAYDELKAVLEAVMNAELAEADHSHFLAWLEENLPGSKISDLIYWPNEWFADESLLSAELTSDQILRYAMVKSRRTLPDAPQDVSLPYPIPSR